MKKKKKSLAIIAETVNLKLNYRIKAVYNRIVTGHFWSNITYVYSLQDKEDVFLESLLKRFVDIKNVFKVSASMVMSVMEGWDVPLETEQPL